jgi:hypothetical protein
MGLMHKPGGTVTNHASRDQTPATRASTQKKQGKSLIFIKIQYLPIF